MKLSWLIFWQLLAINCLAASSWVKPAQDASTQQKLDFWTGFSLFRSPWVAAPSSTKGRDGLGPLFNARSCDACHNNGGSGVNLDAGFGSIVQVSSGNDIEHGPQAVKNYGRQLQPFSIDSLTGGDQVPAEAQINVHWQEVVVKLNNEEFHLSKPVIHLAQFAYGEWSQANQISLRIAPPLFGLGVIEKLPIETILQNVDEQDLDGDGVSGRANRVTDRAIGQQVLGRFGYKAEQPNLQQQNAVALNEDVGLSSWLYPQQTCTSVQAACKAMANGNSVEEGVEISREKLALVTHFTALLRPPTDYIHYGKDNKTKTNGKSASEGDINPGLSIFKDLGCAACHIPTLDGHNYLFSDLLLHDLGEGLADGRPVFAASASEWRTTPLWGLSRKLSKKPVALLHDGRATTIEQAIIWHAGEAVKARERYLALSHSLRSQLISQMQQW